MSKLLIVANGEKPSFAIAENLLEQADLIIACDGAANHLERCDVIIGDFDSLTTSHDAQLIHDDSLMESDLTKALNRYPNATDIIGISGGRPDHILGCMMSIVETKSKATAHFDGWEMKYVNREIIFQLAKGKIFSLFSIGNCGGVTIAGAKFELSDETLNTGTRGLHNEGLGNEVKISVDNGDLLIFIEC